MTKDVIELAREAGMKFVPAQFSGVLETETDEFTVASFAALVAARERERVAQEFDRLAAAAAGTSHNWFEADQPAQIIRALNTEGEGNDKQPASD